MIESSYTLHTQCCIGGERTKLDKVPRDTLEPAQGSTWTKKHKYLILPARIIYD